MKKSYGENGLLHLCAAYNINERRKPTVDSSNIRTHIVFPYEKSKLMFMFYLNAKQIWAITLWGASQSKAYDYMSDSLNAVCAASQCFPSIYPIVYLVLVGHLSCIMVTIQFINTTLTLAHTHTHA